MRLVIDTNVFMAALLSDSSVRRLLMSGKAAFFMPEFALEEVDKYKEYLKTKAGYDEEVFQALKALLMEEFVIVPKRVTAPHIRQSMKVMERIDEKDAVFIAAAIAINADGILSFDRDFLRQKMVRFFEVKDFL